jgi:hypothetical protein
MARPSRATMRYFQLERLPGLHTATGLVQDLVPIVRMATVDPQARVLHPFVGTEPEHRFDLRAHVFLRHLFEPAGNSPDVDDRGDLLDERLILRFEVSLVPKRGAPVFTLSTDLGASSQRSDYPTSGKLRARSRQPNTDR